MTDQFRKEISACLDTLHSGGTILYPTDTIWGIGCDATSEEAVKKIIKVKKRLPGKSQIILLDSPNRLPFYVDNIPLITYDLLKNISTPLTIIYPKGKNLAPNVMAEDGSIAIRIADHEFCRELIREFGRPLVSTSANLSGEPAPTGFRDISPEITRNVDYVCPLYHDVVSAMRPSRIIRLYENGEFNVIRP